MTRSQAANGAIPSIAKVMACCLLLMLPWHGADALFWKPNLGSISKTEKKLNKVSQQIIAELDTKNRLRSDQRVQNLYEKGRKIWMASPANRKGLITVAGDPLFEAGILTEAMVAYFDGTGRTGLSLPYLEQAAAEVRELKLYSTWFDINEELIRRYGALGFVDQRRQVFEDTMRLYVRLGLADMRTADPASADTVQYLKWVGFLGTEGGLLSDAALLESYDIFQLATKEGLSHWGWSPDLGFEFMRYYPAFLLAMAREHDPRLSEAITAYRTLVDWNRDADPLLVANEQRSTTGLDALGNSVFQHFSLRVSYLIPYSEGILNFKTTQPEQRRFWLTSGLRRDLVLAEVAYLRDQADNSLRLVEVIEPRFDEVEASYNAFASRLFERDGLVGMRQMLMLLKAKALEDLGHWSRSEAVYREYVAWSERARDSISVEERIHFFRGQALPAYLGLVRSLAHLARDGESDEALARLLLAVDKVKGRQLLELMDLNEGPSGITLEEIRLALSGNKGLLIFQDLGHELLVLTMTGQRMHLQLISKDAGWDQRLFSLRNRLAEGADFDRRAFSELSRDLLGSAPEEISELDTLFVLNDGALSSIPPGLLSVPSGQLLGELMPIVQIPSLAMLTSTERKDARRTKRLLAVADPLYRAPEEHLEGVSEASIALRGSAMLAYFDALPETQEEVVRIGKTFGENATLLLNQDAAESKLKSIALEDFSHIHLATHGVIGNDLPGLFEPALVLADERQEDGLLKASEVSRLKLDAELTVLSACNTGNGEYFNGEGLAGMGRAFMAAGSRNVIVSLWPVESYSTKHLMERLYEHLAKGLSVPNALFEAQRELRQADVALIEAGNRGLIVDQSTADASEREPIAPGESYSNPFYWSPFVLMSSG